jgi:murein DD-endopeptidase MepM/ murein hydrolase activator NlpD
MFAAYSTPIFAVANGTVSRVYVNQLGGLSIDLVDDAGDRYYYAHLSSAAVVSGQRVSAGQVMGANGDSGNARGTPPHLHWQYHPGGGAPVNPYPLAAALCR